jgi:hypothetical protein
MRWKLGLTFGKTTLVPGALMMTLAHMLFASLSRNHGPNTGIENAMASGVAFCIAVILYI